MFTTMKAVQMVEKGVVKVADVPIPTPKDNEVLVQVKYAGQSPFDWQALYILFEPHFVGNVMGGDISGVVHTVGSKVTTLKKGDRVAGPVAGILGKEGAFAEYAVVPETMAIRVPEHIPDAEATSLGIAVATASSLLFNKDNGLGVEVPEPGQKGTNGKTLLVNGGATSIGTMAIQLAKEAGLRVIATASPSNFDLLKKLGADDVVSYRESNAVEQVKKLDHNITLAVDCVAERQDDKNTFGFTADCLGPDGGVVAIVNPLMDPSGIRTDIKFNFINVYDIYDGEFSLMGMNITLDKEHRAISEKAVAVANHMLAEKRLHPHPVKLVPNGLDDVEKSFQAGMEGKLSGYKPIFEIADTASLK